MAYTVADRVKESTTTTGTGTVTLSGATPGFQNFDAVGNGNQTTYCIASASDWEVGVGTYTSASRTLSRDVVLSSSNGNALVNFAVGAKDVFCALPASKAVTWDVQYNWSGSIPNAIDGGSGANGAIGFNTNGATYLGANTYFNGTNWTAKTAAVGSLFGFNQDGSSSFYKMASVAAGATQTLTVLMSIDTSGNLTATGNVTGYSDERYKTNWRMLPDDIIAKLANVKSGIFDRTDEDLTQVGVSAQSLQAILPEAVQEDENGKLSVAYGNASLALLVSMAQKIVALEARIAALEAA